MPERLAKLLFQNPKTGSNEAPEGGNGVILRQLTQTGGADYYDIEVEGKVFRRVECPIPRWLDKQLKTDYQLSLTYTNGEVKKFERPFLYDTGDSIKVNYIGGNMSNPQISLDGSSEYVQMEIIIV